MSLHARVETALSREIDPVVSQFAARLGEAPEAVAVLFYGSNLRTGSLDGVLDFYVLTEGAAEPAMWPTVSYREWDHDGTRLRAKIATMTLAKFSYACAGNSRDSTIWARFVQPSVLAWRADEDIANKVEAAIEAACTTAATLAAALGPSRGREAEYWRALFRETYKAEFRVEKPGRENSILELNPEHFDGLFADALESADVPFLKRDDLIEPALPEPRRRAVLKNWRRQRRWGKPLNIARLLRATRTFEGAGRYGAWKIERHTGVRIEVTPWKQRHPILAAPGVLWKVWRARRRTAS